MKKILIIIMLVIFAAGCQGGQQPAEPSGDEAMPEDTTPTQDQGTNDVAATVNGEEIPMSEVQELQQRVQQQGQQADQATIAQQLVDQKLLIKEAKDRGLTVSTEEAEEFVEERVQQQGISLEDVKSQAGDQYSSLLEEQKDQLLIQKLLKDEAGNLTVTDEELEAVYEQNKQMLGNTTMEEAKSELKPMVEQQKQQEVLKNLTESLREGADIEISEDLQQQSQPQGMQIQ